VSACSRMVAGRSTLGSESTSVDAPVGEVRCLKDVDEAYNKHSHFGGVLARTAPIKIDRGTNETQ
jgi:hypothetical protein